METRTTPPRFNKVLCIGLGLSGVCLGVQLKRKFGFTDIHFYERNASHSGTWWANRYPGCACDVPAVFYSFSFEQNPNWTSVVPSTDEIRDYVDGVVEKYQLRSSMTYRTECESAAWDSKRQVWSVHLHNLDSGERYVHECRLLFSAVGVLVDPKIPSLPGARTFQGPMFHTARWRSDVDLKDKDVIVVGNGCSATQAVPHIARVAKTITQFIRTPHWLIEKQNFGIGPSVRWAFAHIPFLMNLVRLSVFVTAESDWRMFIMNKSGAQMRRATETASTEYIIRTTPTKYHDILIPNWEVACKRRVLDYGSVYTKALNSPNLHLTKDPIVEIMPHAIRTANNTYPADVIVLATGFETNNGLGRLQVQGRDGIWLADHWKKMGGPGAYNSTAMHGFPNFFILFGPNSTTGHTSVIFTVENVINFALKMAEPVIRGHATEIELKRNAEIEYSKLLQAASNERVWSKGRCNSWYVTDGWNSTLYPWSQLHFWWRSVFPTWNDWTYKYTASGTRRQRIRKIGLWGLLSISVAGVAMWFHNPQWWSSVEDLSSRLLQEARARI